MAKPLALIVEDEADLAIIFAKALRNAGYDTEAILDGGAALTRLSTATPSLVVLDLKLPLVPGDEVLHKVRANPRLADTKVIITTGYARLAERFGAQADYTLMKPVSYANLRDLAARLRPGPLPEQEPAKDDG